MGLLWRLFAPRPLKKARRALHPSWVIEDAIVRSVRGGRRRRRSAPARQAIYAVNSDHPSGSPRIERTIMTSSPSAGWQPPPPQPPRKSWPARHKGWTTVLAVVGVLVVLDIIGAAIGSPKSTPTASVGTPASSSPTPSPTPTASPPLAPLTSTASVTRRHPRTGTKVGVSVVTAPDARITVIAHFETGDREKTARADSTGSHTFWFPLGSAPPGIRVAVIVRVSAHGRKSSTRVWFTPRQPPPPPAPKATAPPPAPPTGCYPKASTGNCYQPGEFCPHADAGMHGVDGSGNPIICEDNNGLRWEPA